MEIDFFAFSNSCDFMCKNVPGYKVCINSKHPKADSQEETAWCQANYCPFMNSDGKE
jgi:hypothetical protein